MLPINDLVRQIVRNSGVDAHLADTARHLEAEVFERLTGTVDGSNRVFFMTYLPDPDTLQLWFRGLDREEGGTDAGDFVNDGYGRMVLMNVAPANDARGTDAAPKVRYRRLFTTIVELDADTIPAIIRPEEEPYRRPPEITQRHIYPWHERTA